MIKKNHKNKIMINILYLLFALILVVTFLYARMIYSLPLFGDATIHGYITKQILIKGVWNTNTMYPPLYNIFQGILFTFFGEKGMNSIIFLGVVLVAISVFLMINQLIDNKLISMLGVILVICSPKVIFYSSRMYMEILLSGFFVFTIYLLIRYIKNKNLKNLIALSFFTAITSSIKQQGSFILFPSIFIFLIIDCIYFYFKSNKTKKLFKRRTNFVLIFFILTIILTFVPYLTLFHNSGEIIPANKDFKIINFTDNIGQIISGYQIPKENKLFDQKWNPILTNIQQKYYSIGSKRAESRQIWPWQPLISWKKFKEINGLYITHFAGGYTKKNLANIINYLFVLGLILFVINIILKNKILKLRYFSINNAFAIFLVIFITINYILFLRNTDQMRYQLFIAIILTYYTTLTIYYLITFIKEKTTNIKIRIIVIAMIFLIITIPLFNLAQKDTKFNSRWYRSQAYSPSKGGIASVEEAGHWLENNTRKNDLIWMECGNEIGYYSMRKVTGNWEYFFLNKTQLKDIFNDQKVKYIVIANSQIVKDNKWKNFCWVPKSFQKKISQLFPKVYETSFKDINIYKVTK